MEVMISGRFGGRVDGWMRWACVGLAGYRSNEVDCLQSTRLEGRRRINGLLAG